MVSLVFPSLGCGYWFLDPTRIKCVASRPGTRQFFVLFFFSLFIGPLIVSQLWSCGLQGPLRPWLVSWGMYVCAYTNIPQLSVPCSVLSTRGDPDPTNCTVNSSPDPRAQDTFCAHNFWMHPRFPLRSKKAIPFYFTHWAGHQDRWETALTQVCLSVCP